ncbi:signal recognition particle-docking protein FtsY [Sinorhizobium mexicanum]|uniref:Signal recognition particle receptor FtsY n=1 Tax=Sinorhizobium mexicanum TaxID=375549 RepID=A0A859QP87_9HYPH|nr:signal recognition particle-docking protein FtsY [Sinorhizobium mexicanum]
MEKPEAAADDLAGSPETTAPETEVTREDTAENTPPAADENAGFADEGAPPPISPPVGMPGRTEGGEETSPDRAAGPEDDTAKAVTPPSVPDQGETEVTTEGDRSAPREEPADGDGLFASSETESEDAERQEPEATADRVGGEAVAMDDEAATEATAADNRSASREGSAGGNDLAASTETEDAKREEAEANAEIAAEEWSVLPPISPLVGEMPGRAEGGETRDNLADTSPHSLPKGFATADKRPKEAAPAPQPKLSWYQRLRRGLARTSSQLTGQIASLFTKRKLDEATLQDLEDLLIQADLGVETAMRITDTLASERYGKDVSGEDVSRIMAGEITKVLAPVAKPLELDLSHKPHVILVVGVNGTGKTTTIGKLAAKLSGAGLKVMLAAGDTFRAAAIEQLKIWAERTKSDIVSSKLGADAAGLAYEAFQLAREKKSDVLIIDTAGRLQNKAELMAELEKIVRVLGKLDPDAPHTVLQTLDATTGQNALQQVEIFRNVAGVSGLIMTKLDGTARGGILVAISAKHKLPVYFIGVGEGIDDLEPFEAKDFADVIAGVAA